MSDEEFSAAGHALAIELLLDTCRDGTFYEDHDESLMMLHDAEEALNILADAAIKNEEAHTVRRHSSSFVADEHFMNVTHNLDSKDVYVESPVFVGMSRLDRNTIQFGPLTIGETYEVRIFA